MLADTPFYIDYIEIAVASECCQLILADPRDKKGGDLLGLFFPVRPTNLVILYRVDCICWSLLLCVVVLCDCVL